MSVIEEKETILLGILINYLVILPPRFPDCARASPPVHTVISLLFFFYLFIFFY